MRTLFEIVEGARDGQKPTHDECYFAMLALGYLLGMDHRDGQRPDSLRCFSSAIATSVVSGRRFFSAN